jgi:predicted DNA-binding protein
MIASVRMSRELEKRLTEASKITGKNTSDLVREAVELYCDQLLSDRFETLYDAFQAQNFPRASTGIGTLSTDKRHLKKVMNEAAKRRSR